MEKKLLYGILMLLPFLSGVFACLYTREVQPKDGTEWYLVLGSTIPFLNLICALILVVLIILKKI